MSGELPNGWEIAHFGSVVENHDGRRIPVKAADRAKRQGQFPYYGASGVIDHVDDYLFDGNYLLIAEDGANLLSRSTPIAFQASGQFWVNNHAHIVQPSAGIPIKFLEWFLNSIDLAPFVSGSAQPKLTQKSLETIPVPIAPGAEQRRIVDKIGSLFTRSSRARDALAHIPKLIERYRQAVLEAAFRGDLTADWRNGEGQNWREVEAFQLFDEGPTNGYSPKAAADGSGTKSLKLSATTTGTFILNDQTTKRLLEEVSPDAKYWLQPGDILIQRANSLEYVGATALFDGPAGQYIYPDLMMRVRIASPTTRMFFWRYMNSAIARNWLKERATGTAGNMPKISGTTLKVLPVPLPPEDEQAEIVSRIEQRFAVIEAVANELGQATKYVDRLDQSILDKAFTGKLVPQDPNDEPASKLLERIQAARAAAPKAKRGRRQAAP